MKHWISAARPRTLPLALSSILMGSFLAAGSHAFSWTIFGLAVFTTTFLQILSNFANDYGDTVSGVDNVERTVATRATDDTSHYFDVRFVFRFGFLVNLRRFERY
jgi:1,4-dihydroxy-2-naphthoate polyprenyltransferase